jgi:hypothetical protein
MYCMHCTRQKMIGLFKIVLLPSCHLSLSKLFIYLGWQLCTFLQPNLFHLFLRRSPFECIGIIESFSFLRTILSILHRSSSSSVPILFSISIKQLSASVYNLLKLPTLFLHPILYHFLYCKSRS